MEAKDIFEANSRSVKELFCQNGQCFYIPPYQRNYSWSAESVDKLINDSLHGFNKLITTKDSFTFVGTIITIHDINNVTIHPLVKHHLPSKVLAIIDGQQRLTTLLMICIAMHNRIKILHSNFSENKQKYENYSSIFELIDSLAKELMGELTTTFIDRKDYGEKSHYPRMIRAFKDTWSTDKDKATYESPLANLIRNYDEKVDKNEEFKPTARLNIEGEKELVDRYTEIVKRLKKIKGFDIVTSEDEEDLPTIYDIIKNKDFQEALLNHNLLENLEELLGDNRIAEKYKNSIVGLVYLLLFCKYILNRVALTVVRGKDEDYAFTIFESLNTTGEPLTAFETFKPRVVNAEGLGNYESSDARKLIDEISNYFSSFRSTEVQKATSDTLISFALAESGRKLPNRLAEQRIYLRSEYDKYNDRASRNAFVAHLRDTAKFIEFCWGNKKGPCLPVMEQYTLSEQSKLCLIFLYSYGHTVTIAPLVRYFSEARFHKEEAWKDFECALKAMTAFSILWRTSHSSTSNLDQEYRQVMTGHNVNTFKGLARAVEPHVPGAYVLQRHFYDRLLAEIQGSDLKLEWIKKAKIYLQYGGKQSQIAKFILLAAYNDAVVDNSVPGLVKKGRCGCSPQLSYNSWIDENTATLEHIAPQNPSAEWPKELYSNPSLTKCVGNLVLLPQSVNSSLGNRGWERKQIIYSAFAEKDIDEAKRIIEMEGIDLSSIMKNLNYSAKHNPQLESIIRVKSWDAAIIEKRAERILELAWDVLFDWLQYKK